MSLFHKQQEKLKQRHHYLYYLLLLIYLAKFENANKLRNLKSYDSEIRLTIQGNGTQNIISNSFTIVPSEVFVNGIKDASCGKKCFLTEDKSNITLKFTNQIGTMENMFKDLINITEIDLSILTPQKLQICVQRLEVVQIYLIYIYQMLIHII